MKAMSEDAPNKFDVVLLHSPTEDGAGVRVVRARPGQLEAGEVRPAKDGQPLNGAELVTLKPREDAPQLCDVEVLHAREPRAEKRADAAPARSGPAQVATRAYRKQWDRVFGKN